MLLADQDQVDSLRDPAWSWSRWVAAADEHAPRGIEPALDVVVHTLAAHDQGDDASSLYIANVGAAFGTPSVMRATIGAT